MKIRKPKLNVSDLKKKHKKELKNVSKKNPVYSERMLSRQNKEVIKLQDKLSKYKKQESILLKERRKEKKLFEKTKNSLKGKSKDKISKIWANYRDKKKSIKIEEKKFLTDLFKTLKYSKIDEFTTRFTNQQFYRIESDKTLETFKNLYSDIKKRKAKPNYILIILEGVNKKTGDSMILSDSFSYIQIGQLLQRGDDFIENLTEAIKFTDSGINFELKSVIVRLIYDN